MIPLLFIDIFANFFLNIFNIIMIAIFLLVGVILGIFLKPGWGNTVMKLIPRDHRFIDFTIDEETAVSIECKDEKGFPPQRFIKLREGFIGRVGRFIKRQATRYVAKEGTAYTWRTEQTKYAEIPGGLSTAVLSLWGQDFYDTIPDEQRAKLENNQILVTVDLEDGLTPEGMRSVSEEDIKREEDRQASETFWKGKKTAERGVWLNYIIYAIAGFGLCAVAQVIGLMRI